MRRLKLILLISIVLFSCRNSPKEQAYTSGSTHILVDESFAPIIEDQAYVFENTYPKAKLNLVYKPENELMRLFLNDSIQVAVISRVLTKDEAKFYESRKIKIRATRFAIDGIALITHQANVDSTTTVLEILNVLQGKSSKIKNLIFDNSNSSTVRYFKEMAGVRTLPTTGVYALKSNSDVINYVHENPGSVGVVGVNWMLQPDTSLVQIVVQLKVLGVKNMPNKLGSDAYYKPSQNNIALGLYPFTRSLYIINCQGGPGLGAGFASFLAGDRGQRIILKSGLLPDRIPSREVIIRK